MTILSAHFSLEEATISQSAIRRGIDNQPDVHILKEMKRAAAQMEIIRTHLGNKVISVSSWYRSEELNKAVGGARNSSHMDGNAIDFNCFSFGRPLEVCKAIAKIKDFKYDQLIHEYGRWIHIGFGPKMRQQQLTVSKNGTTSGLYEV